MHCLKRFVAVRDFKYVYDVSGVKKAISDYNDTLDRYIPVLMAQAKIYWDTESYSQVENLFHKSVEFCEGNETWRLHVAHVLYMQDKFKEAIAFYEPIVNKFSNNVSWFNIFIFHVTVCQEEFFFLFYYYYLFLLVFSVLIELVFSVRFNLKVSVPTYILQMYSISFSHYETSI